MCLVLWGLLQTKVDSDSGGDGASVGNGFALIGGRSLRLWVQGMFPTALTAQYGCLGLRSSSRVLLVKLQVEA